MRFNSELVHQMRWAMPLQCNHDSRRCPDNGEQCLKVYVCVFHPCTPDCFEINEFGFLFDRQTSVRKVQSSVDRLFWAVRANVKSSLLADKYVCFGFCPREQWRFLFCESSSPDRFIRMRKLQKQLYCRCPRKRICRCWRKTPDDLWQHKNY